MSERRMVPMRLPSDLLREVDAVAGPRGRTAFVEEAMRRELVRRQNAERVAAFRRVSSGRP